MYQEVVRIIYAPMNICRHNDIVPYTGCDERVQYECAECKQPFPQSLIEEKDGKLQMVDLSHFSNRPRKRRR
jgi:hypothetical protein